MKIAVIAATPKETEPVRQYLEERRWHRDHHVFRYWTTGVGLMHTTHALLQQIRLDRPQLAIQAGIGGTFQPLQHPPGSVVAVTADTIGDLGVLEPDGQWQDVYDLGLADPDAFPHTHRMLQNPHQQLLEQSGLPGVRAVTVNQITSGPEMIRRLIDKYHPAVESMEGAAFHFVCLQEKIPFIQFRAVSNVVGERDKSRWLIKEALTNVQESLIHFLGRIA